MKQLYLPSAWSQLQPYELAIPPRLKGKVDLQDQDSVFVSSSSNVYVRASRGISTGILTWTVNILQDRRNDESCCIGVTTLPVQGNFDKGGKT